MRYKDDEGWRAMMLREYRGGDVGEMFRLDALCFEEAFRFSERAMRRYAEGPGAMAVVTEDEAGGMVGFAIGEVSGGVLYLVTLDVAPACRRRGIARAMLLWLEGRAAALGVRQTQLHVSVENGEARLFYEREGFTELARVARFYGWGRDALLFAREVAGGCDG